MLDWKRFREKLGELLQTSRWAMLLELVLVFSPMTLGLMLSERTGSDQLSLGGEVVLIQGPTAFLGLAISLVFFWAASRLRGVGWGDFGLARPKSWGRTLLISLCVALAVFAAVKVIINPVIGAFPNLQPRDMSRVAPLEGSLPNLIANLVGMYITAAFLEELLWRGYLIERLLDLVGKRSKLAWAIALLGSAAIFGLVHIDQGLAGMFKIGAVGLVFGLSYLAVGRNLWPLIIAHGLIDTLDFVSHYFGG
jgi:membrane protease YdiL (CAAX protease family)